MLISYRSCYADWAIRSATW